MGGKHSKSFTLHSNGTVPFNKDYARNGSAVHDNDGFIDQDFHYNRVTGQRLSKGFVHPARGEPQNGPDEVLPATESWTCDPHVPVKLRLGDVHPLSEKPQSVPGLLADRAKRFPHHPAVSVKRNGEWLTWTYKQYYEDVRRAAKSFIQLGLEPYHGVGILGFNSPEWFISDLAAIFAGGLASGIYATNSPEACQFVAADCEANIIVVEDEKQLMKILQVKKDLPHLKAIVQYLGSPPKETGAYSWTEFMELASNVPDAILDERIRTLAPNKCCTLIYTSGTTGTPKGVMLTHDNLIWTATRCVESVFGTLNRRCEDVLVSYLPLSHIAAQMQDLFFPIVICATVYLAQPDALKGTLVDTMKEVRPTVFMGVPRVFEKIQEKMQAVGRSMTGLKKAIGTWAKEIGLKGNMAVVNGESVPWGWTIANILVFKNIRKALGLDRCHILVTGAAPITRDTLEYFMSINLPLYELYGMSESTGPHTVNLPSAIRVGSVGRVFEGASNKLFEPDEDGEGEVCMRGRHVFIGYLGAKQKTEETIDEDGWLHSGDIGRVDADGYVFITGRIKELLITAGGENVAPVPIEDRMKKEVPIISNVMLVGDKRKFISMIFTLKVQVDLETGEPSDNLTDFTRDWLKKYNCTLTTATEIIDTKPEKVFDAIQAGVDRANKIAVSRAQIVQKWSILPGDFSIPGSELGPTLKLRRPVVHKKYADIINEMYPE